MDKTDILQRLLRSILLLWTAAIGMAASPAPVHFPFTHPEPLLPDSSNFVTASLVIIDPGPMTVSAMGHSAIRLECPAHNLDYCFTLENNPEYSLLAFILGKTPAHDIAVKTDDFMKEFIDEKRRVLQYELNLTLHEKQELWRAADNEFTRESHRLFNYSYDGTNNCTSICLELIEKALIDEHLVVDSVPPILLEDNGTYLRHMARRSPWTQFVLMTIGGTACDDTWNMRNRMSPEIIIPLLMHSHFEGSEGKRPALTGQAIELTPNGVEILPHRTTPLLVFGLLLFAAVLVTLLQRSKSGKKMALCFDAVLFIFQIITSMFLLATSCFGSIVGIHWNWYLIPFNPLPLVLWLCCRKQPWYPKVFVFYTVVLVLFILATPLSSQLDIEHQLITATLAIRCAAKAIHHSR